MNLLQALRDRYQVTTDPLRTERRLELIAVVLALLLFMQLVYGVTRVIRVAAPVPVMPAGDALRVQDVSDTGRVDSVQSIEIRERPLFWVSRRAVGDIPVETDTKRSQVKTKKIQGLTLVGVFGSGDSAGIILLEKGKRRRLMRGEKLNGWTLKSVSSEEAMLVSKGQRDNLVLRKRAIPKQIVPNERKATSDSGGNGASKTAGGNDGEGLSLGS
jgi:hypothetical protein